MDIPKLLECEDTTSTDWWQGQITRRWRYHGVSPLLRFMKYPKGGHHAAHYDAGYIYADSKYRTLFSFVAYFSTNKTGATRIIRDGQENTPIWDRNHADWDRDARPDEIVAESLPVKGNVLFFQHRIPHDVAEYTDEGQDRIIIRGDLIYNALEN